jgi:hypothetical protein
VQWPYSEHMEHANLVHRYLLHEEEGTAMVVVVEVTSVGSNGVASGS